MKSSKSVSVGKRRGRRPDIFLDRIRLDGDTQPRDEIDEDVVLEYAELYRNGVKLPPIVVFYDGKSHWLVDGFHRRWGAVKAKLDKLPCEIHEGTLEDARWFSYAANQTHGLRRSNADKRKAVLAALRHPKGRKMSDEQIGEYVGVHRNTVLKYRQENEQPTCTICASETRTGRDERTITVKVLQSPTRTGRDGRTINVEKIGKGRETKATASALTIVSGEPAEAKAPTCPNCGGHRFDDDGDCLDCHEPDVAPATPIDPANYDPFWDKLEGQVHGWIGEDKQRRAIAPCRLENLAAKLRAKT